MRKPPSRVAADDLAEIGKRHGPRVPVSVIDDGTLADIRGSSRHAESRAKCRTIQVLMPLEAPCLMLSHSAAAKNYASGNIGVGESSMYRQ